MKKNEVKQAEQNKRERDFTAEFWAMVNEKMGGNMWYEQDNQ